MGARKHQLDRRKKPFHQARFFHENAHEDKKRYGGQGLFQHDPGKLVRHQVKHQLAKADISEHQAEKNQGKGDREANKDGKQHAADQDQTEDFVSHSPGQRLWVVA